MATVTKTYKIGLSDTDKANLQSAIETRITGGQVTVGTANKAVADQNGAVIDTTYVKHNTYDQTLSVAKADIADNVSLSASDTSTKPYKFDITGNSATADVSSGFSGKLKKLQGTSVVFNQITINTGAYQTETKNGITFTNNGDGTWTLSGTATADTTKILTAVYPPKNHKFLLKGCYGGSQSTFYFSTANLSSLKEYGNGLIYDWSFNYSDAITCVVKNGTTLSNVKVYPQLFDLTLMFGNNSRIPNGLNGTNVIEYATDGDLDRVVSPSAIFSRLFPLPYYDYDAGTITSVKTNGKLISVGRNAFDVSQAPITPTSDTTFFSQYIKVIPEEVYSCGFSNDFDSAGGFYIFEYDENQVQVGTQSFYSTRQITLLLSPNTHYIKIDLYYTQAKTREQWSQIVNTLYFQLRHSGNYVGYKAYEKHELAIPSVELKGIYGGVGDTYESSGKKIVKFASVDLGTLNYVQDTQEGHTVFKTYLPNGVGETTGTTEAKLICSKYIASTRFDVLLNDKQVRTAYVDSSYPCQLLIYDTAFAGKTPTEVKALLNGVMCVYQLNTPTETDETQFTETFYEDDMGTIEFEQPSVGNYSPVGHQTSYQPNASDMIQNTKSRVDTIETKIAGLPFSGISGYDATKSQHLEQHSGTLVWVDNE